jgi:hypothetical protein
VKKSKESSDLFDVLDKQYKAMLLMLKLTASISVEVKQLTSVLQEQNALLKQIVSSSNLEEDPV